MAEQDPRDECEHGLPIYEGCWQCKQATKPSKPAGPSIRLELADPFAEFR